MKNMEIINHDQFHLLTTHCELVTGSFDRPKMMWCSDTQCYIKTLYMKKRTLSTTHLSPYAYRFCQNAEKLAQRGIKAPHVQRLFYCPHKGCYLICYPHIDGQPLNGCFNTELLKPLSQFIAELHQKGIYFNDCHLRNILLTPSQDFALIDIHTVKTYNQPLSRFLRRRHIARFFEKEYRLCLWQYDWRQFLQGYFQAMDTPYDEQHKLLNYMRHRFQQKKLKALAQTLNEPLSPQSQ